MAGEVKSETVKYKPPDGGYGWLLVLVSIFTLANMSVIMSTFTVMYMDLVEAFDSNVVVVGTLISYHALVANFSGLLFGGLLRMFDVRLVTSSAALISACFCFVASFSVDIVMLGICFAGVGAGFGMVFLSVSSIIQQYFVKKRTMAYGFVMAGMSLGNFSYPPLARLCLDRFGWRITLSLCSYILIQNVWLCAFYRPLIPLKKETATTDSTVNSRWNICRKLRNYLGSVIDFTMIKDPAMFLFLISCFLLSVSFMGYMINLVNKALSKGVDNYRAAFVASVSGMVNALCRPTFGVIATVGIIRKNKCFVLACLLLAFSLSLGILGTASSYEMIIASVCLVSIFVGSISTLHLPTLADTVEAEKLPGAIGLVMAFAGTGQFCGPPITGWAYDKTGSYDIPYYILGGFGLLSSIANFMMIPIINRRKRSEKARLKAEVKLSDLTEKQDRQRKSTVNSLASDISSTLSLAP